MIALLTSLALATPTWPDLADVPDVDPSPRDAALVVAIEDYSHVADIPGARQNGTDWYRYLVRGRGVPPDRVRLLIDGQATRPEIELALDALLDQADPDGTLWVVFIGHGAPSRDGHDGLLLDVDVRQSAVSVYDRGVSRADLVRQVDASGYGAGVVVLDACFTGQDTSGQALVAGLQPLIPSYADHEPRAVVLSATGPGEFAGPLPGLGRPAFSYLALGGLRGWADADSDGAVTASEAVEYAASALRATVTGRTQTPQLTGIGGVLAHGAEPGPDLAEARLSQLPPDPPDPVAPPVDPDPPVPDPPVDPPVDPTPIVDTPDPDRGGLSSGPLSNPGGYRFEAGGERVPWADVRHLASTTPDGKRAVAQHRSRRIGHEATLGVVGVSALFSGGGVAAVVRECSSDTGCTAVGFEATSALLLVTGGLVALERHQWKKLREHRHLVLDAAEDARP